MWPVIGHEFAVELLARSIQTHTVNHAYLVTGPSGIGKTTLARAFARALNCSDSEPPCGLCRSCQLAQTDRHPDIRVIAPDDGHIKIDAIRDLQNVAALSPVEGRHRVFIISQIDYATTSAANCLLKTLEEPPEPVVLILTADRAEALLPTIVSRCQVLALRPLATAQIVSALRARGIPDDRAALLGHLATGRIGWAIAASDDDRILERRTRLIEQLIELRQASYGERFSYVEQLCGKPDQIPSFLHVMSSWWHDILLCTSGSTAPITNIDQKARLDQWASHTSIDTAYKMLEKIQQTAWQLEHNVNQRLSLEVLMLDMPRTPQAFYVS